MLISLLTIHFYYSRKSGFLLSNSIVISRNYGQWGNDIVN
ncbi:hypothetical protein NC99_33810 [Sunxiuqinia dokdonensis]|uniref:Uncharacterized protein n=1 Tax=Sunxiuqinia dokdonensis TaxID=1409788 RepID=A0A0L8V5W9_9BACT|nr:hypothetical protein NC99_33810 [Sunxiuqinia dokdonensis]